MSRESNASYRLRRGWVHRASTPLPPAEKRAMGRQFIAGCLASVALIVLLVLLIIAAIQLRSMS